MIENLTDYPSFTIVVCASFLLDWAAIGFNWKRLKPFTKSLVMVLVLCWTLITSGWQIDLFVLLLLLAQISGLAGDVFLLLSKKWFISGLLSFLIGHFFYLGLLVNIIANHEQGQILDGTIWRGGFYAVIWAGILLGFYMIFRPSFKHRAKSRRLWVAVQLYIWILSALVIGTLAVSMLQPSCTGLTLLLPIGGTLFLLSDSILAYDRFIQNLNSAQLAVRVSYHLAQLFLAMGFFHVID